MATWEENEKRGCATKRDPLWPIGLWENLQKTSKNVDNLWNFVGYIIRYHQLDMIWHDMILGCVWFLRPIFRMSPLKKCNFPGGNLPLVAWQSLVLGWPCPARIAQKISVLYSWLCTAITCLNCPNFKKNAIFQQVSMVYTICQYMSSIFICVLLQYVPCSFILGHC